MDINRRNGHGIATHEPKNRGTILANELDRITGPNSGTSAVFRCLLWEMGG